MPENESCGNHQPHSPTTITLTPQKRRSVHAGREKLQSKRAKYNTNACENCKKRKLRCDRKEGERDCHRCMKTNRPCIYAQSPSPSRSLQPSRPSVHVVAAGLSRFEEQSLADASVTEVIPGRDITSLRDQVASLGMQLKGLGEKLELLVSKTSPHAKPNELSQYDYSAKTSSIQDEPQQPLFVGHTRSAFSLDMAKTSLSQMGISTDGIDQTGGLPFLAPSPRELSPGPDLGRNLVADPPSSVKDPLLNISLPELRRLIAVFHEEIEVLYPFVSSDELIAVANTKLKDFAGQIEVINSGSQPASDLSDDRDIDILKIAIAIAIVIEAKGKNKLSSSFIDSTDKKAAQVTRSSNVDLRDLQWLTMMAIYYFHIDEDLLAWRTIGNAARMTLEMGLHRRRSLMDNYKSTDHQEKAKRVFWCVYALDRRWSFGIGLPFALNDRDIDPELPEPGDDFAHLRCLVGWGRLCSKVWEALPPYGSPTTTIPVDQVQYLEFLIRNWLDSIPPHLQFNHLQLEFALGNEPRTLRRLCTLLYLRGNHLRTLIHRHVLSPNLIHTDLRSSRLVVDIAKDSIQVLVNLAETSDIYTRQQATFNYFLLSALAVMLLAVCNAPQVFYASCHESFSSAVTLVRNFSRGSLASRRLWNSIRGLLPAIRTLGLKIRAEAPKNWQDDPNKAVYTQNIEPHQLAPNEKDIPQLTPFELAPGGIASTPDTFQMGNDLMGLFNVFGQTSTDMTMFEDCLLDSNSNCFPTTFPVEIARHFQALI
ncbi:fungal-specific transcription factor domain-containing protein [Xylaria sp. FL1777]|nr:fungal-specific transcription factor domain-containing protein [Xylaria sp. FL1777]